MMLIFVIAFLMGDVCIQQLPSLPNLFLLGLLFLITLFMWILLARRYQMLLVICAFILGMGYTTWYARQIMLWELPKSLEKKTVKIVGHVASLPITVVPRESAGSGTSSKYTQTSFTFALNKIEDDNTTLSGHTLVKLTLHKQPLDIHVGDEWAFYARLKRIYSTQNSGSFDYEAWSLQKGLRATGYLVTSEMHHKLTHNRYRYPIEQFREKVKLAMEKILPDSRESPWLMALIIGERGNVNPADWQVLRNTGTNHLMAIAGLHVGIIAGFIFTLAFNLWRVMPRLALILPAKEAAALASLIVALFYSALAGFSIPTLRASIMLSVFIIALLLRRKINPWSSWMVALLIVLIINPLSVLTESFWLSFATLALIIYGMHGRIHPKGFWWKWGRVQWVIGFGLIPFTLSLFQQFSVVSFLANCIAIPWLGYLILPFCLLSSALLFIAPSCSYWLLWLADKSLAGLWLVLTFFSNLHFSAWQLAMPNHFILCLSVISAILLLLPHGTPGKWFGLIFIFPLLFYRIERPAPNEFWLNLLDVGQGLSLVVETHQHTLVYDAGPKYNTQFDMGESVVLPFLLTRQINKIDMLVISHADNDHIGGAHALVKALPVSSIKTSEPEKIKTPVTDLCRAGASFEWDGVNFAFLYPYEDTLHLGNDSSCVLHIDNGSHSVLLTGDIEKFAEKELLARTPATLLDADILIAPHHGSKTSGLQDFIYAVHPQYVLYGIGYLNRYHFPHQSVVDTYRSIKALQYDTAASGAITFKLKKQENIAPPIHYRVRHARYWYVN